MITVSEYFEGAVKSLGYQSHEGKSTIGVIESGEYEFGTSLHETMLIIEGELKAKLPGNKNWEIFRKGQEFEIDANQSFKVRTASQTSYLCKYK
ncbi:MAG: pyrimidine/purine nucleoside phosphorylase [Daejeonella sp.]|uniref:pyrimidine/purine nucleoside phosphorylase n=1 Tax=Daejeonella sp. TaxID=2805397 RepID=UPI00273341AA|nr:pyrimidine/purine nucleoside phosphorylase [Daejeonella sp.]MDP3469898.1 pyrimidine/purine nucleoside phosphorylase [Daejeonella sp.]